MSIHDIHDQNSILVDFVRTIQPDIADADLQHFVNDFLETDKKTDRLDTHLSYTVLDNEAIKVADETVQSNAKSQQQDLLMQVVKEAVLMFLEKKYQEEKEKKQQFSLDNSDLLHAPNELNSIPIVNVIQQPIKVPNYKEVTSDTEEKQVKHNPKWWALLSLFLSILLIALLFYHFTSDSRLKEKKTIQENVPNYILPNKNQTPQSAKQEDTVVLTKSSQQPLLVEERLPVAEPINIKTSTTISKSVVSSKPTIRKTIKYTSKKNSRIKSAPSQNLQPKHDKVYFGEQH